MERYLTLILVFVVLLIGFLISGCVQEKTETTTTTTTSSTTSSTTTSSTSTTTVMPDQEVEISLSTDKETYHSNEHMDIAVTIDSPAIFRDVGVRVYGIKAGSYRLDKTEKMNLSIGVNTLTFSYKTPRCTGCAGIRPGNYQINVDLIYTNDFIARATKNVEIKQ